MVFLHNFLDLDVKLAPNFDAKFVQNSNEKFIIFKTAGNWWKKGTIKVLALKCTYVKFKRFIIKENWKR